MFSLSSQGLSAAQFLPTSEKITINVGTEKYRIPTFVAVFLSPKVSEMLQERPKLKSFTIQIDDETKQFRNIIKLAYGDSIKIDESNAESIRLIGEALGNNELVGAAERTEIKKISKMERSVKNVIEIIKAKNKLNMMTSDDMEFAASNFYNLEEEELVELPIKDISKILSSPSLMVETESHLFNFICNLVQEKGSDYVSLFAFVLFEYINEKEMKEFVKMYRGVRMTDNVWSAVARRLVLPVSINVNEDRNRHRAAGTGTQDEHSLRESRASSPGSESLSENKKTHSIHFDGQNHRGIFNMLRGKKGSLKYSASSINTGIIANLVNPTNKTNFWTQNQPDSWIRIDLKKGSLKPSSYTMRGRYDFDYNQCQSWNFEGMRGGRWEIFDSHDNRPIPFREQRNFPLKTDYYYEAFRIRQIGPNTYGDKDLVLSYLEIYGDFHE